LWGSGRQAVRDGSVVPRDMRVRSEGSSRDLPMVPRLPPRSWLGGLGCPHLPTLREIFSVRLGDELPDDLGS
jgi:hypothetical protein